MPWILFSEFKQYSLGEQLLLAADPFRFVINLKSFSGGGPLYESKCFWLLYATQGVPFVGCNFTLPILVVAGPSLI